MMRAVLKSGTVRLSVRESDGSVGDVDATDSFAMLVELGAELGTVPDRRGDVEFGSWVIDQIVVELDGRELAEGTAVELASSGLIHVLRRSLAR